jgi:hypothetical protein
MAWLILIIAGLFEVVWAFSRRCCMEAVDVAGVSTKPMYYVTRTESGFATRIMRFSARTAIATSPC